VSGFESAPKENELAGILEAAPGQYNYRLSNIQREIVVWQNEFFPMISIEGGGNTDF
jgi:hypothetical protein